MGINSVNQQFRGFGRVSTYNEGSGIIAFDVLEPYQANYDAIIAEQLAQSTSPQAQAAGLAQGIAAENIRLAEIAVRDRLGISFESWAKLVTKYKEMTNKKYILDYGVAGTVFSSTMDRTLYFDHVEIEVAIKLIREEVAKNAAANAPQTAQVIQAPQVPIPQPLQAPIPLEAFSSFSLDAPTTTISLPKALPKTEDKPKDNTLLYAGIGVGVLALCGGAYWYFSK